MKKILYNKESRSFSTKEFSDIYDQFGESIKLGDKVIFYYADANDHTPRLYKGILKSWDKINLIGTIESLDFDRSEFGIPKLVKIDQHLISKE